MFRRPDFTNASKEILQLFLGGVFFLPWRIALSILESIICNDIKYHWLYTEFLIQLRLSLTKTAVYFKVLFFMDNRCILEKLAYFQDKIWIYLKLHLHQLINHWVHYLHLHGNDQIMSKEIYIYLRFWNMLFTN